MLTPLFKLDSNGHHWLETIHKDIQHLLEVAPSGLRIGHFDVTNFFDFRNWELEQTLPTQLYWEIL